MQNPKTGPQKNRNSRKNKKGDTSWIDTDRVVNKAQHIISSAVNILEDEIAAGILAAKKIEKKLIDVNEVRSNPNDLVNRIRRDSHELLDLFIDVFASVTSQMNSAVEALKKEPTSRVKENTRASKSTTTEVTVLEPDHSLKPGETTTMTLTLHDDESGATQTVALRKADLVGPNNQKISLGAITIAPTKLSLMANEEKDVTVTVKVPREAKPGRYNALLTDTNNPKLCILIAIDVVEP